jgi:3-methylcrotonyl-CoA carboxylase alpha subunit
MFNKILIANRGEIACRVAETAHKMRISTVAVYSDADAGAKHVAACDEAFRLGPAAAKESYLKGDTIIAIAKSCGAQAIHPGYGFLSENEDFAQACADAGLVFIGPPPAAIRAMGLKAASKQLMEAAKVPLVPGYHGADQDAALLQREADGIGYPVLIKASAGGGGKGMRIVEAAADFAAALASCKREAINSFGDDAVLIEKYLTRPRHIEIQVFGDTQGNFVYLFERDCSVQRRHQKVLEEAPAPGLSQLSRAAMGEAAVAAARAVGYQGAGTVEFIANQDGSFYFMEMNTRLQVEHPVTEMITGLDLVEWQLRVACGERLPLLQHELKITGHALEARVYAENPTKGFLPSTGTLRHLRTPQADSFRHGGAVRIDSGVREGDAITPFYDPMIAKLIVWGSDRAQALQRMHIALGEYQITGLHTNVAFLRKLVACPAFAQADLDTGLIEKNRAVLFPEEKPAPLAVLAAAAFAQCESEQQSDLSPFAANDHYWPNLTRGRTLTYLQAQLPSEQSQTVVLTRDGLGQVIHYAGNAHCMGLFSERLGASQVVSGIVGETAISATIVAEGKKRTVFLGGERFELEFDDPLARDYAHTGDASHGGKIEAPMPGKILSVLVAAHAVVTKGTPLVVMEAMKMEHTLNAPADGTVGTIHFQPGDQVAEGAELLGFKPAVAKAA